MSRNIKIHRATADDKDFIIESILAAEKSGTDLLSYCAIFNLTEKEFTHILGQILDEDLTGQELCFSGFLIAQVNGMNAAAICSWAEGDEGASSLIKANTLMYFIGKEKFMAAMPALKLLEQVNIERTAGAIQLESVYTKTEFRGLGLSKLLIDAHIAEHKARNPGINKAQIILMNTNVSAIKAYEKAGFHVVQQKNTSDNSILKFLPGNSKLLMEKTI